MILETHDSMNDLLRIVDTYIRREKMLRSVIDDLFIVVCKHCTEDEIREIQSLDLLQKLARGDMD